MVYSIFGEQISIKDWTSIGQVRQFVESDNQITLTASSVRLTGRAFKIVDDFIIKYGREINVPVEGVSQSGETYQFYLDIKNQLERSTLPYIQTAIQVRKSSTHFFEAAGNLSFEVVNNAGLLTNFTLVPYQIFPVTTALMRLVLIGQTTLMAIQLINAIFELGKLIAAALDIVGTGVLTALAEALAYAAWVVGLLAILYAQGQELRRLLAPPIRNLKAMSDYRLLQAACQYLGFAFESNFMYERRFIETVPVPEQQPGKSMFKLFEFELADVIFNKGYPRAGDTVRTPLEIINWWNEFYNTETKVFNGIVRIETPEYFAQTADVTLESQLTDQDNVCDVWRYNNDPKRTWRRKFIGWANDPQDVHTQDIASYNVAEYLNRNKLVPAGCEDLAIMNGFSNLESPFALMRRKDELFPLEKLIHQFFETLDSVSNFLGGSSDLANEYLDSHVGVNIISGQFFGVTKKIWNEGDGKQPADYLDVKFNTDVIYEDRHKPLEFAKSNCRWQEMRVPMHPETFQALQANNYAQLDTGESVKIIDCKFYEELDHRYADIVYQASDPSGFNVETVKIA